MKIPNRMKPSGTEALRKKFLKCIGLRSIGATALPGVVKWAIKLGISRGTLVAWAVQAGYARGSASNLLCRIYKALGLSERQPGAGRIPSPDTLELLAYAKTRFGERHLKVLHTAWWRGKAEAKSASGDFAPQSGIAGKPPVAPPLRSLGANNVYIIRRNGHATNRDSVSVRQPTGMILKRNGNTTRKSRNQTRIIRL
jgi:hypothetical protein